MNKLLRFLLECMRNCHMLSEICFFFEEQEEGERKSLPCFGNSQTKRGEIGKTASHRQGQAGSSSSRTEASVSTKQM